MATTGTGLAKPEESERPGTASTWTVTIAACVYLAWMVVSLYRSTAVFGKMYVSMDAALQGPSWFVIHHYRWFYPCFLGSVAALLIIKQFFVRRKWVSLTVTLAAVAVLEAVSNGIVGALYRPLFDLTEKLK